VSVSVVSPTFTFFAAATLNAFSKKPGSGGEDDLVHRQLPVSRAVHHVRGVEEVGGRAEAARRPLNAALGADEPHHRVHRLAHERVAAHLDEPHAEVVLLLLGRE